jgi:hypothetical protein
MTGEIQLQDLVVTKVLEQGIDNTNHYFQARDTNQHTLSDFFK